MVLERKRTIKFNPISSVLLFGGAPLLIATAKELRRQHVGVHVFTSPRHLREALDSSGTTLASALAAMDIPTVVTDDINTCTELKALVTDTTLGLGMGEAWTFGEPLINRFGGRLLDMMGIPLPRYRGGAHYTWMILRGDREGACNLQVINSEMVQGERDTGEIVKTRRYQFPDSARRPVDYFDVAVVEELALIIEFLDQTREGHTFELSTLDEQKSLFLPRLNTMTHGWVDWTLDGSDIERFICAFDEPYPGASTIFDGQRVHVKAATLDRSEPSFHPFQSGLVTRVTKEEGVVVATRSGHLCIRSIAPSSGGTISRAPRPGDRFVTPQAELERAFASRVTYGAT